MYMFIYSLRASTLKFAAVVVVAVGLLVTLIAVLPTNPNASGAMGRAGADHRNIRTNEDRVAFLESQGWTVAAEPLEVSEVLIPREFDAAYSKYNEIQKQQGMNLERAKNRTVTRYTYLVTNYDGYTGMVIANLLIHNNTIIAADICTADVNGFVHGLERDNKPLY
jgi:hypothetical protein